MDLILWRHAEAEVAAEGADDLSRKLTKKGERQAAREVRDGVLDHRHRRRGDHGHGGERVTAARQGRPACSPIFCDGC